MISPLIAALLVPFQLVERGYTQALGRPASIQEMTAAHRTLNNRGCSAETVLMWHRAVLDGTEAQGLLLNNRQRVRLAYRVALGREPDKGGWDYYSNMPFQEAMRHIIHSPESAAQIQRICYSNGKGYGVRPTPLDDYDTDTTLRQQLANASPGTVITLNRPVLVNAPLTVPQGVILQGATNTGHYSTYARIIRGKHFAGGVIEVAGGTVRRLYIDGRMPTLGHKSTAVNVRVIATGSRVDNVHSHATAGWSHIVCSPHFGNIYNVEISNNAIFGYAGNRSGSAASPLWSDSVSNSCSQAVVRDNYSVDATDVHFISFNPKNSAGGVVHTYINNTALNVGVDSWGMFGIDPLIEPHITDRVPQDFSKVRFIGNNVYTLGPQVTRVGVFNGTSAWDANRPAVGKSAIYEYNRGLINAELYGSLSDDPSKRYLNAGSIFYRIVPATYSNGCRPKTEAKRGPDNTNGCLFGVN